MKTKIKCCICGKIVNELGHNAQPLKEGMCCSKCNCLVINERIRRIKNENKTN